MAYLIRRLVSRNKRRFQQNGFDLDLTYVTPRIIAMGFPAEGREGWYRNPVLETKQFLERYHKGSCRVYNLCSERESSAEKLGAEVVRFPMDDHQAPSLQLMLEVCQEIDRYLGESGANVAAVHCKAGKGRTGLVICAYLMYTGMCTSGEEAMDLYSAQRTLDGRGVTVPSQRRYIRYFQDFLHRKALPHVQPLQLQQITISGLSEKALEEMMVVLWVRPWGETAARPYVYLALRQGELTATPQFACGNCEGLPTLTIADASVHLHFPPESEDGTHDAPWLLSGDIKIQVFRGSATSRTSLFYTWFNTSYVDGNPYRVERQQLDKVRKSVQARACISAHFAHVPPFHRLPDPSEGGNGASAALDPARAPHHTGLTDPSTPGACTPANGEGTGAESEPANCHREHDACSAPQRPDSNGSGPEAERRCVVHSGPSESLCLTSDQCGWSRQSSAWPVPPCSCFDVIMCLCLICKIQQGAGQPRGLQCNLEQ
ncbi:hypothetical protein WJX72_002018 [[Myrmecia] bisecta]|uniref:Phosphatidylinositol 3,4,5-trisphosphate 3-phosphatase and dual-specificity protein phosphatase PTEN n=1 Tax=[Myrmecia] bisecta TaxID=41462 RepID=A0AAW1R4T5_9CHLO